MPAVFPPWSNAAFRIAIGVVALTVVAIPCALMVLVRTPYITGEGDPIEQPVMFDHRHHVRDNGMDCRYCHSTVETSTFAGMPPTELCMGCHGQIWTESPLLAPVRKSWFEKRPIVWARVNKLPDFLKFDHSSHVQKGVGCVECHGRVDKMAEVRQAAPLTMGWCIECHRAPEEHLRPLDRITDMSWVPDRPRAEVGREIARQLHVAPSIDCTTCHM
jgi:hypothetical protein